MNKGLAFASCCTRDCCSPRGWCPVGRCTDPCRPGPGKMLPADSKKATSSYQAGGRTACGLSLARCQCLFRQVSASWTQWPMRLQSRARRYLCAQSRSGNSASSGLLPPMEMIGICTPVAISRVGTCTAACAKTAAQPSAARRPSIAMKGKLLEVGTGEETAACILRNVLVQYQCLAVCSIIHRPSLHRSSAQDKLHDS